MWPDNVRPLVEKYGVDRVEAVCLDVLQFPLSWGLSFEQTRQLAAALRKDK